MSLELLKKYEDYIKSFPTVTPAREIALSKLILGSPGIDRDRAIWELVNGNLRRVLSLTRKHRSYPDYLDIVFDGNLGLVRAATNFDSDKGKFSTHSTHTIRTAIRDGMSSRLGIVHIPRTTMAVAMRIREAIGKSNKSDVTLATDLGVEVKDVVATRLAMLAMLDAIPLFDKDDNEFEIPDPKSLEMFDKLQKKDLLSLVTRASKELNLTEDELVLVSEANLHSNDGKAMAPILAKKMGLSSSTIRHHRAKLVWEIRRRILSYVGGKEYLALSALGKLPARRWKDEKLA